MYNSHKSFTFHAFLSNKNKLGTAGITYVLWTIFYSTKLVVQIVFHSYPGDSTKIRA
jgi:hypothetical protein